MADSSASHQRCAVAPNHIIQLAHVGISRLLKIATCVVTQNPLCALSYSELSKRNSVLHVDVTILRDICLLLHIQVIYRNVYCVFFRDVHTKAFIEEWKPNLALYDICI
jgi:hypothetical protein